MAVAVAEPSPHRLEPLPPPAPVAVVELFTSEGCSSCPPADDNLAAIAAEAASGGQNVLTLELHVNYWDDLGWPDPFASRVYTDRQRRYADHFGARGVYTPQLVVNGREELVGSRAAEARSAIARALTRPAKARVAVAVEPGASPDAPLSVTYRAAYGAPGELNLAVVEDAAEVRVLRGENARRTLSHHNVVRAFAMRRFTGSADGAWTPAVSPSLGGGALHVVGYVTDAQSLAIVGAGASGVLER